MKQRHLDHTDTVNYGSYYTPETLVDIVYALIKKNVARPGDYCMLDTSCGYGGFLRGEKAIGADIDEAALQTAKKINAEYAYFRQNSLLGISRSQYNLPEDAKIIAVGNPPYNDTTSIIRNRVKKMNFERDADVLSRDVGISFLLSYDKLQINYVCVLHPLSYLIKRANFESLGRFRKNYKLIDSVVISSGEFADTSKTTQFPIIIALYERNPRGMEYDYIAGYDFMTHGGKTFSIQQHDSIGAYITKYPNQKTVPQEKTVALFYTMRDINALKRGATFVNKENHNTIRITKEKLPYYCYVDIFKDYIPHIPYYFGNCDIMINNAAFWESRGVFMEQSAKKHPFLRSVIGKKEHDGWEAAVNNYFKDLLAEHYVD
ncbi:MAG: hypothetical protein Pg6C_19440 [Treponemataceae bacterium]|nr:MAG: hypothetical protein Pg6C_19440 [Treponemataceae bacterium]